MSGYSEDIKSSLIVQICHLDDIKSSLTANTITICDTVCACLDDFKSILDKQSSSINDVKSTVTALLPDVSRPLLPVKRDDPLTSSQTPSGSSQAGPTALAQLDVILCGRRL